MSNCFAALRQIRSVRQVILSIVVSLVLQRLDFGNATLVGLPAYQLSRLQYVLNTTARLVFSRSKYDHVTPLLQELHWLRIEQRIEFKLSVLVFRCLSGLAPSYLSCDFLRVSDLVARQRLRSSSTSTLVVPPTRLSTAGDSAFPVAAARTWNSLPTSLTTLSSLASFRRQLKTELFVRSFPDLDSSVYVSTTASDSYSISSFASQCSLQTSCKISKRNFLVIVKLTNGHTWHASCCYKLA